MIVPVILGVIIGVLSSGSGLGGGFLAVSYTHLTLPTKA